MQSFNINTDALVGLTNKLEQLHESAMPIAVRGTLNDAAFDMKQVTAPREFNDNFTIRKKTFFRSHTRVNKSKNTFDIDSMESSFGVIAGKSKSGDELEKQEHGGIVANRTYIPFKEARIGKTNSKLVSKRFYLKNIKASKKNVFTNQEVIKASFRAGKGGYIIYDDVLFEVRAAKKRGTNGIYIKLNPVYSYKENRSVKVKKDPFMLPASIKTRKKMTRFYMVQANKRFKKYGFK